MACRFCARRSRTLTSGRCHVSVRASNRLAVIKFRLNTGFAFGASLRATEKTGAGTPCFGEFWHISELNLAVLPVPYDKDYQTGCQPTKACGVCCERWCQCHVPNRRITLPVYQLQVHYIKSLL